MQIIEVTGFGVRSAVVTLRRRESPLRFVLFPMLHVASPAFYTQVRARLEVCDVIVAEGIRGKSRQMSALTLAYRFAPRRRRSGLVEQKDAAVLPAAVPRINPDVTAAQAVADLKSLPRWTYALMLVAAPAFGLVFAVRGPRAFLDTALEVEDLPKTRRAEARAGGPVSEALMARRDQLLLDALGELHTERSEEPITVAVVYGAGHMPAVAAGLRDRYGYRPREAEWLTVYSQA